jgi:hypothetical protein
MNFSHQLSVQGYDLDVYHLSMHGLKEFHCLFHLALQVCALGRDVFLNSRKRKSHSFFLLLDTASRTVNTLFFQAGTYNDLTSQSLEYS